TGAVSTEPLADESQDPRKRTSPAGDAPAGLVPRKGVAALRYQAQLHHDGVGRRAVGIRGDQAERVAPTPEGLPGEWNERRARRGLRGHLAYDLLPALQLDVDRRGLRELNRHAEHAITSELPEVDLRRQIAERECRRQVDHVEGLIAAGHGDEVRLGDGAEMDGRTL